MVPTQAFLNLAVKSADGLMLAARDYPGARLPIVCLPGLTRTAADFAALAETLCAAGHRVLALDYRGRGQSDRDPNWQNYSLPVESEDIGRVLAAANVARAAFVGTSRGGLHIMLLAAQRPDLIAAAVLNDVGPVLEPKGLARIAGYVGKVPPIGSLAAAVAVLRASMGADFTALSEADWATYARLTFEQPDGTFAPKYDAALARTFDGFDPVAPLPTLWPQFDALARTPLLLIRGSTSDLLSPATFAAMAERHADSQTLVVEGQGHAPLLLDAPTIGEIARFIETAATRP